MNGYDTLIHIVVADDHAILRDGLQAILALQPDMQLVGQAQDGHEAVALAQTLHPDVLLLDLSMPRRDGLSAIPDILLASPRTRLLVLTGFADDDNVYAAIKAGALGYLLKDTPRAELLQAIRDVAAGRPHLSPLIALKVIREIEQPSTLPCTTEPLSEREMDTLRHLARGLTNREIADALHIHERTIAKYVSNILDKLHLANRTQAALYALRQGLARLE